MSASEIFRSKKMSHCSITLPYSILRETLGSFIDYKIVQFEDQNSDIPVFQRLFSKEAAKAFEIEQKLLQIRTAVENAPIEIRTQTFNEQFISLVSVEDFLDQNLQEYKQLTADLQQHQKSHAEVYAKYIAYSHAGEVYHVDNVQEEEAKVAPIQPGVEGILNEQDTFLKEMFVVVPRKLTPALVRNLFRVTYSNIYYDIVCLEETIAEQVSDLVYVCVTGDATSERCKKVFSSYQLTAYNPPQEGDIKQLENVLGEFGMLMGYATVRIQKLLAEVSANIDQLHQIIQKEKEIINVLNMFQIQENLAQCTCWVVTDRIKEFQAILDSATKQSDAKAILQEDVASIGHPPTFFPSNKYTEVFMNIVNAYGTPSYQEINPAFFYLYHFPFTYSIMFGDIGHGLINAICGMLMIIFENKLKNVHSDMFELIFMGRFMIFIMSCFSIITGFVYNDLFALGFNFFGTKYRWPSVGDGGKYLAYFNTESPVYSFGMDPFWHWGDNSMIYLNSYKMKLSVCIGILQMIFGVIVKLINHCYFKNINKILTQWIPEFLFLVGFFGYMVFSIVYKWLQFWPIGSNPPSLINMLIQIFLAPGKIDNMGQLFNDISKQQKLQMGIFVICVIAIVWLISAEPIAEFIHRKKKPEQKHDRAMSDIAVSSLIETIEYVLGCISHTASYLRLWALSLAHSQLAEVFFNELLGLSLNLSFSNKPATCIIGGISLIITYACWFGATIAVLNLMEALSAFLHCLRLAWIEFNSKFFAAEGYSFEPFGVDLGNGIQVSAEIARSD